MNARRRTLLAVLALAAATPASGVQQAADREGYFRAVAEFVQLPPAEVTILSDWRLPADEIPVVLFIARRAGVSAEALVALRRSGRGWSELAGRYGLDASHFHVPLPEGAAAGRLDAAYGRFRASPVSGWSSMALEDGQIVDLVNLRLVSQTLRLAPEAVLRRAGRDSWVQVYGRLLVGEHR